MIRYGRRVGNGSPSFRTTAPEIESAMAAPGFRLKLWLAAIGGISLLISACGPTPRVSNFDAARVAVEVSESAAEDGSAGTYAIALLEFSDLRNRYVESQPGDELTELTAVNGQQLLESSELVWASVVTLDVGQGRADGNRTGPPQHRLVLVDINSGLPLFSALLESNLALPGGLHTVSELERAP